MVPNPIRAAAEMEVLSPSAQRVYLHGVANRFFTVEDARRVVGTPQTARKAVVQLAQRGYALRVYKGLYAAVPAEYIASGFDADRYLLASRVAGDGGALAFHSALEIHGVAQSAFTTSYCLVRRRVRPFSFQGIDYRFVNAQHLFGVMEVSRDIGTIHVTDKERTLLDCIRRPDLCGGLEEVLKSIGMFRMVDTKRLGGYLGRFSEAGLMQRTGFVLSLLQDAMRIPDEFLTGLRIRVSKRPSYLVPRMERGSGRLNRDWNVIAPRNLDEVMRPV
jgi:predicted transcriptional regulator of viral defense system